MNDLREKLAEIVSTETSARIAQDEIDILNGHEVADAIIAAMPGMVQPLVWVRHPIGWNCAGFMIDTRSGLYVMRGLYGKPRFDTLEAAQAACNAHHVANIMQAFGVQGGET